MLFAGSGLCLLAVTPCSAIVLNGATAATGSLPDVTPGFTENVTSTLYTGSGSANPQQMTTCPWIIPSLTAAGYGGTNWNFTFDNGAGANKTLSDLSIGTYQALAINDKGWTDPIGGQWAARYTNAEAGGAFLQLNFNPTAGDPLAGKTVHWIQALDVTAPGYGQTNSIYLDAGAGSPFYDASSAGGPTWFFDNPSRNELEYEGNPVADWQGQVFLAVDNGASNGITHNVTIYGGEWWGFQLAMADVPVPEPASLALVGLGAVLLCFVRRKAKA